MSSLKKKDNANGKAYWRSLDQLADTPEFNEFLHREFPQGASEMSDPLTRRSFMTLMGASMALAGLVSCRRPVEKIVPYVKAPEEVIPGIAKHYATTMPFGTSAYGVIVESHEGRPTKIEGNPKHPSSLGSSNSLIQASMLDLYDPDRSKVVLQKGAESSWADFVDAWRTLYTEFAATRGEGLAVLSESFSSPTMARLQSEFKTAFPRARWVTYEPVSDENVYNGIKIATGRFLAPSYQYDKAKVILALDSDFLLTESENIANTKGFSKGRRVKSEKDSMNRLYAVEPQYTITGGMADHRLRVQARRIGDFAAALANELKKQGVDVVGDSLKYYSANTYDKKWLSELAKDLIRNRGNSLIVAGRRQPAEVHALVFALNTALGNVGNCVSYYSTQDKSLPDRRELATLVSDMQNGSVKSLVVLGGNPVYNAPGDLKFASAYEKVANRIHFSTQLDETAALSSWHLPGAHFLESWGDARATDGTMSIVQPLIAPLYGGRTTTEILNLLATGQEKSSYELVRDTWRATAFLDKSERNWRRVLHDGVVANSALTPESARLNRSVFTQAMRRNPFPRDIGSRDKMEYLFATSASVYDGRYANNGWLQELPDPVTKVTWENVALVSVRTAKEAGVKSRDIVALNVNGQQLEVPVWVQPGTPENTVVLELGFGRSNSGRVGNGAGFNAYPLRSMASWDFGLGATVTATGRSAVVANTQDHSSLEGRAHVREATLDHYREKPNFAPEMVEHPALASPWNEHMYSEGYQWGMAIDLNSCTGCNACSIACQSENNIPIVGKDQVDRGREMHWMRMDRYYSGDLDNPEMVQQPVGCQHCELAPCEQVCPVAATVHDKEGLNVMTYNRCIGTRYCSNNCPYKVRKFNFFNFTSETPEVMKMAMNPDVTVRFRGVMEKCTYCTQRINEAKIVAKREERSVRDGDIVTACQQTCPADAIVFGNINDPDSRVTQIKKQNRNYAMLSELNVRPRTTYLARLRNPNPALAAPKQAAEHA